MTMNTTTSNPWIGLDSYREGQILYGRSREIRDLSMAVFHNRQTVVYGRSGIGKSSLLHAGIFPEARLRGCLPVSVRFNHSGETGYSDQLFRVISDAVTTYGGVMTDTVEDGGAIRSLWEFFHRFRPEKDSKPLTPLIVVDQFEEIFTLSKSAEQVRAFFDELADLLNDVMPDYLQSAVQQTSASASGGSMFDGLDFHLPDNRYMQDANFHLVLALREDYLSYLERYSSRIPALKQNRYGLLPITYSEAMEIITQPRPGLVSEEVADKIIRQVVTDEDINPDTPVDSAILSLFLSRLYEKKGDAPTIERRLVEEQGDALLEDFYAEIVAPLDKKTVWFLEDTLINADGHRENVTLESLYKNAWLSRPTVDTLEKSHLLRLFSYGDVQRLEFAHDVLCPIIVRRRTQRLNEERYRKSRRRAIWSYVIVFAVLFLGLEVGLYVSDKMQEIKTQKSHLSEMEASLIEKGAQKMLDNHDIYGAIRLLLNSLNDDPYIPTETMARKEVYLRRAIDSLRLSKDSVVALLHFYALQNTNEFGIIIDPTKRIFGYNDVCGNILIADANTGAFIQVFSRGNQTTIKDLYNHASEDKDLNVSDVWILNGRRVSIGYDTNTDNLRIADLYADQANCLIIADDTTLLDCYLFDGLTRLCIHVSDTIKDAAFNKNGHFIAILLADSSRLLYDWETGKQIHENADEMAQDILSKAAQRRFLSHETIFIEEDQYYVRPVTISLTDNINLYGNEIRRVKEIYQTPSLDELSLFYPDSIQIQQLRAHLDTIKLPTVLRPLQCSYDVTTFDGTDCQRYIWPLTTNKTQNRIAMEMPINWNDGNIIYCVYPHNFAISYEKPIMTPVHSLNFTEDDQYLVINAGEDTEEIIYLPPLPQLMDTCRNMFFDWGMTYEDGFQTFIHMND